MKILKNSLHVVLSLGIMLLLSSCPGLIDHIVTEDLGNGFKYHEAGGFPQISKDNPYKSIPSIVVDYSYDDSFITAIQKEYQLKDAEIDSLTLNEQLFLIKEKGKIQYWIIVKESDSIFGPFKKIEYQQKCNDL